MASPKLSIDGGGKSPRRLSAVSCPAPRRCSVQLEDNPTQLQAQSPTPCLECKTRHVRIEWGTLCHRGSIHVVLIFVEVDLVVGICVKVQLLLADEPLEAAMQDDAIATVDHAAIMPLDEKQVLSVPQAPLWRLLPAGWPNDDAVRRVNLQVRQGALLVHEVVDARRIVAIDNGHPLPAARH